MPNPFLPMPYKEELSRSGVSNLPEISVHGLLHTQLLICFLNRSKIKIQQIGMHYSQSKMVLDKGQNTTTAMYCHNNVVAVGFLIENKLLLDQ